MTIATASIGLYSLASTLLWGRLIFDVPLHLAHPVWFADRAPGGRALARAARARAGLDLRPLRNANSLSNLLEYPVWLVTGLLVGALAAARLDAADLVGARADLGHSRDAARPRSAASRSSPVAVCLGLGAIYLVIGHFTLRYFERLARERATLSLA